jgi:hypothetical protein
MKIIKPIYVCSQQKTVVVLKIPKLISDDMCINYSKNIIINVINGYHR